MLLWKFARVGFFNFLFLIPPPPPFFFSPLFPQKAQHSDPNKPQNQYWKIFLPRIFHDKYFWLIFASSCRDFSVYLSDPLKVQAQVPRLRASIFVAA